MLRALSKAFILAGLLVGFGLFANTHTSFAQGAPTGIGDGCAESTNSLMNDAERTTVANLVQATSIPAASFSCQDVSSVPDNQRRTSCVSGLCPGSSSILCCIPSTGAALNVTGGSTSGPTGSGTVGQTGGVGRLALPSCVSDGNCELDDLVTMAVNFSNFLFGISGAIFLLIFVYAGFRLIFFAPDAGTVKEAKSMLVKATMGMIIIALAGVVVTYLYNGLRSGRTSGGESTQSANSGCSVGPDGQPSNFVCTAVTGIPGKTDYAAYSAALENHGCRPSPRTGTPLCSGSNYCCPPGTSDTYVAP